jgi:hypothetical protein
MDPSLDIDKKPEDMSVPRKCAILQIHRNFEDDIFLKSEHSMYLSNRTLRGLRADQHYVSE